MHRCLHVAALPFPTRQGTQAAVDAIVRASVQAGRVAELLTYGSGLPGPTPAYLLHRGPDWLPAASLRSGPSLRKLLADVALAAELGRVRSRSGATLIVAHHVEAALIAAGRRPCVFFAHTDLRQELPEYAPRALGHAAGVAGETLDRALVRRADAVATVSPWLRERMAALAGERADRVRYVPLPWPLPPPITPDERSAARAQLELPAGTRVVAYAGNLDRYQGWEALIGAAAQLNASGPRVQLLVATASEPQPLWQEARRAGIADRVTLVPLGGEDARRAVHAAADIAAIPRRVAGGVPVKLLDALARGVPCVVTRTGSAGLPLAGRAHVAAGDDDAALSHGIAAALCAPERSAAVASAGRNYIATEHDAAAFLHAFDAVCERALRGSPRR